MELNFEVLEVKKWNMPTSRTQNLDKKNEVICLDIMFALRVIVIEISKMAHFCIFCWWLRKSCHSLGKIFKYTWKILFFSLKMVSALGLPVVRYWEQKYYKNCWVNKKYRNPIFLGLSFANGSWELSNQ